MKDNSTNIGCNIIGDLLPSYVDDICSEDTKKLIEEHISECDECRGKIARMRDPEFSLSGISKESEEVLAVTEKIKARERKNRQLTGALGVLSGVLAVCLVISILPFSPIRPSISSDGEVAVSDKDNKDTTSVQSGRSVETVDETFLGVPSGSVLGDYTAASSYDEIYDYVDDIYRAQREYFVDDIMTYRTDSFITEDAAESTAAAAGGMDVEAPMEAAVMKEESVAFTSAASEEDLGHSTTNLMTEGVDESDISKTDGDYIYNATGSEIIIFDIREGEPTEINRFLPDFISSSDIIREIFIDEGTMSIITEHADFEADGFRDKVVMLVYDVSDRESPVLKGKYRQDGSYKTSRKTGDIIYLFTEKYIDDPGKDKVSALSADRIGSWFPTINDAKISPDCVFLPQTGSLSLVISSFDQTDPTKTIDTKVIVNDYAQIYVGSDSIYLYSQVYSSGRDITKISKLGYDKGMITTGQTNTVRGHINDSFAINEYKGFLRLVTSEWDGANSNSLYILDEDLKECGRISNIAEGETLYACRFMGDTGYFVTFRQTDPLFSVDLKDPQNPRIIGELKIPGFSEYLHFWGEDKLLGIGYEADNDGMTTGIKLSMFDISDPANVTEESKKVLDEADYAPGFYNYKAILASPGANLIGFGYYDYTEMTTDGYYKVYSYEGGEFTERISKEVNPDLMDRIRGHYSRDHFYISENTKVQGFLLN